MECFRIDSLLDTRTLPPPASPERAAVAAHLAECPRCADAVLSHELLAGEAVAGPRVEFLDALRHLALAEASAPRPARRPFALPGLGLAAAAILALAAVIPALVQQPVAPEVPSPPTAPTAPITSGTPGRPTTPTRVLADTPRSEPAVPGLVAGLHYDLLPLPAPTSVDSGIVEVCEFFSFYCVHCFNLEPELAAWSEGLPANVELVRVPVIYDDATRLQARAFYTASALGEIDRLRLAWYREIHERGNALASRERLRDFFASQGIAPARFEEVFDSFQVEVDLRRAETLNRAYRVTATPSLYVNGKYLARQPADATRADLLGIVDALVEYETSAPDCSGQAGACPPRQSRPSAGPALLE